MTINTNVSAEHCFIEMDGLFVSFAGIDDTYPTPAAPAFSELLRKGVNWFVTPFVGTHSEEEKYIADSVITRNSETTGEDSTPSNKETTEPTDSQKDFVFGDESSIESTITSETAQHDTTSSDETTKPWSVFKQDDDCSNGWSERWFDDDDDRTDRSTANAISVDVAPVLPRSVDDLSEESTFGFGSDVLSGHSSESDLVIDDELINKTYTETQKAIQGAKNGILELKAIMMRTSDGTAEHNPVHVEGFTEIEGRLDLVQHELASLVALAGVVEKEDGEHVAQQDEEVVSGVVANSNREVADTVEVPDKNEAAESLGGKNLDTVVAAKLIQEECTTAVEWEDEETVAPEADVVELEIHSQNLATSSLQKALQELHDNSPQPEVVLSSLQREAQKSHKSSARREVAVESKNGGSGRGRGRRRNQRNKKIKGRKNQDLPLENAVDSKHLSSVKAAQQVIGKGAQEVEQRNKPLPSSISITYEDGVDETPEEFLAGRLRKLLASGEKIVWL